MGKFSQILRELDRGSRSSSNASKAAEKAEEIANSSFDTVELLASHVRTNAEEMREFANNVSEYAEVIREIAESNPSEENKAFAESIATIATSIGNWAGSAEALVELADSVSENVEVSFQELARLWNSS